MHICIGGLLIHAVLCRHALLCIITLSSFYVHGSVHRESVSTTVQQDATIFILLRTALHVSGDNFTHHQENM